MGKEPDSHSEIATGGLKYSNKYTQYPELWDMIACSKVLKKFILADLIYVNENANSDVNLRPLPALTKFYSPMKPIPGMNMLTTL